MKGNKMNAVKLNEGFDLVCVWPATLVGKKHASDFENWFKNEFDLEVQYLEEVTTLPDRDKDGNVVEKGGRNDVLFAIKREDASKLVNPRLHFNIHWVGYDVHQDKNIYPEHVKNYLK